MQWSLRQGQVRRLATSRHQIRGKRIRKPCEHPVNFLQYSCLGPQNTLIRKCSPTENEVFDRQGQVVEMPLDAAPSQEMNQFVSRPRVTNSRADGKARNKSQKPYSRGYFWRLDGAGKWNRSLCKTQARDLKIALMCGNTSSRNDKSSCDRCHKMLRKLQTHTTRDILQIKLIAVRTKSRKDVLVKRMQTTHAASSEMLKDAGSAAKRSVKHPRQHDFPA
mmetsp:Transcript_50268/g.133460  ORF Transcript_50268/g.133460 Transcript_50268/m.133460 type:complete len:220 (+) Transcript_50268:522-1181(+)